MKSVGELEAVNSIKHLHSFVNLDGKKEFIINFDKKYLTISIIQRKILSIHFICNKLIVVLSVKIKYY